MTNDLDKNIDVWNKWDLHIHSPKSNIYKNDFCGGKGKNCTKGKIYTEDINSWAQAIAKKWKENNVTLASITDHNLLDKDVWAAVVKEGSNFTKIIPGIEVDAYMTDSEGAPSDSYVQLIIHINPEDLGKIIFKNPKNGEDVNIWNNFYNSKYQKKEKVTVDDVIEFFVTEKIRCNLSVEGEKTRGIFNKKNKSNSTDVKRKTVDLFNWCYITSLNDSSFDSIIQSQKKWKNLLTEIDEKVAKWDLQSVSHFLASDNHCPEIYPQSHHAENRSGELISFFNGRNNFLGLCLALRAKNYKIRSTPPTDINSERHIKYVEINSQINLEMSQRLNVIIGPRSSGKTLFLKFLSIYGGVKSTSNNKYKELSVFKQKKIKLVSFDGKNIPTNNNNVREFEQNCFIDPLLAKKPLSIVDLLKLEYPPDNFSEIDEKLKKMHYFYSDYKNFLKYFFLILKNSINLFKNLDFLIGKELGWYTIFSKNLADFLPDKDSVVENFGKYLISTTKSINSLRDDYTHYKENVTAYNNHVETKKLKSIFPTKMLLSEDDFNDVNLIKNLDLSRFYIYQFNQLKKRIASFEQTRVEFKKETDAALKNHEELIIEHQNNKNLTGNLFKELGESLRKLRVGEIIVAKEYSIESHDSIPKRKYNILPTRVYKLKKENKDVFNRVITAPLRNLISDNPTNFRINTLDYLDVGFITRNFIQSPQDAYEKIFMNDSYETNYEAFRSVLFKTVTDPVVKQNGKKIEDNSPGKIAQIYFDIEVSDLLEYQVPIVLFDQPEDSIDNRYVANKMTEIIRELTNKHKQVFIVTHNPNLVVNTFPDNIIIPYIDDQKNIQYSNGRMEDEIVIGKEKKSSIDWICDYVEGGKRSFFERLLTYEVGWSYNNDK